MGLLTPARRRGVEIIDDPALDGATTVRSLEDVARSNTLFGGRRAVLAALDDVLADADGTRLTLLDVGTGVGDIPWHARRLAARRGVMLDTYGVELSPALALASRARVGGSICADAFALPFADGSVDVVTCSQVAHHFAEPELLRLLCELDRVARRRVVVADLRRSYVAAAGFWLAAWPLRFHPVTRHDGVVSVFRGFTPGELGALVTRATGAVAHVRRGLGWRVVSTWTPGRAATVSASVGTATPSRSG
ncbi:MAG TPA: methyltransferase domain-containing protein [Gemmatirosa sp.]